MNQTLDLLQIKIDKARAALPSEALAAINAVDWRTVILEMRETKRYTFEQLGDLEIETDLVLSGLLDPKDYPRELETRMKITKTQANELVDEMNRKVFSKIREELIKRTGGKVFPNIEENKEGGTNPETSEVKEVLDKAGINLVESPKTREVNKESLPEKREEILKKIESPESSTPIPIHPILAQKLGDFSKSTVVETEHSLENITKKAVPTPSTDTTKRPAADPYREIPE